MKSNEIAFRRINGRIVPIRVKKGAPSAKASADLKSGAALTAAGASISLGSGELASQLVKKSAQIRKNAKVKFGLGYRGFHRKGFWAGAQGAFDFVGHQFKGSYKRMMKSAATERSLSRGLFKLRNPVLIGGAFLGGSLMAAGLHRLNRQGDKRGVSLPEEIATNAAGIGAAGLGAAFYYRRLGLKSLANVVSFATARMKKSSRPWHIPINFKFKRGGPFKQGTLKF